MNGADFNKLEQKQAKRDGGKAVKNSGRGIKKGDAIVGDLMVDYKFCSGKSFSLNVEKWKKHAKDAWREQKTPVIVPIFDDDGVQRELAIIDWQYLKELLDEDL